MKITKTVSQNPSDEEFQAAVNRHVAKSAEIVARIPFHLRTILSKSEAEKIQGRSKRTG